MISRQQQLKVRIGRHRLAIAICALAGVVLACSGVLPTQPTVAPPPRQVMLEARHSQVASFIRWQDRNASD